MKKVYVAMSGGVDSSVAAALLKQQVYDVTGVFFKPWQPKNCLAFCNWKEDRKDALKVCVKLGIPFLTWDFSDEYYKKVAKYMISGYKKSETPNPDVMCNKEIKFGLFLRRALAEGADFIATGHYARLNYKLKAESYQLTRGKDKEKDQSYFLYNLTQKELRYCMFPIGNYTKAEVRKLAKKFGLPTANKKDSQGVCFVGDLDMKEFLKEYISPKQGSVKTLKGEHVGAHDGLAYYTIGQRHGFTITNGKGPYFVAEKDTKRNILYVDTTRADKRQFHISNMTWINKPDKLPMSSGIQIRYRTNPEKALISQNSSGLTAKFLKPQPSITPGQSAVFYNGEQLLGGGTIK